ncbi:hypothetical protein CAEBREN_15650 [Caenorhabditis brenneri]|uniref:F-box domain-containing protein n=1 Tax=Caenorhabditis brenneri TaxID=135651 RepID=G0NGR2_CAEBE|nr:hypothetical protein CAEBREN_15650 [Caenorhabditis brenneri]
MSFPLHKLPMNAALHVLRRMVIHDQLTYSLCSKNTKRMVKSLGLRATTIQIIICSFIEIDISFNSSNSICFSSYFDHGYYFPDEEFRIPWDIEVCAWNDCKKKTEWEWFSANIGIREYLHHFIDVLQHPRIDELFFNNEDVHAGFIVPVQKVLKGLQILELGLNEQNIHEESVESLYC